MLLVNILKAVIVRLVLLVHSFLAIWQIYSIAGDKYYWLLAVADVAFIIEGFVTIIARKGKEYKWFCPCFFFYLGATLPSIWLLELDRRERYSNIGQGLKNTTLRETQLSEISGVSIPVSLPPDTWVLLIEQFLLYFMIVGRWLLPRGKISRNELSQLLFVFIGMASDITEFFTLFDEDLVRQNLDLTYAILVIWTVSLLQFCFVLTATKNSKRPRVALQTLSSSPVRRRNRCEACVSSEIWSTVVTMCMQDVPFLIIRLFVIIRYELLNYGIIFFTAKNVLVTLMLLYRTVVICKEKSTTEELQSDMTISVLAPNTPNNLRMDGVIHSKSTTEKPKHRYGHYSEAFKKSIGSL